MNGWLKLQTGEKIGLEFLRMSVYIKSLFEDIKGKPFYPFQLVPDFRMLMTLTILFKQLFLKYYAEENRRWYNAKKKNVYKLS